MARRTLKSEQRQKPAFSKGSLRQSLGKQCVAFVSSAAVACMQVLPAFADVVAGGQTATTVSSPTGTVNVTTGTVVNSTGFNHFSEFNVSNTDTVNLFQPIGADALVNIISGGSSVIDGAVNGLIGNPIASVAGGNLFFVNSAGFVVSANGVINAGQLTLTTPTSDFVNDLLDEANDNFLGLDDPTQKLFAGEEPLSATGVIDIQDGAQLFATRLDMRAGLRMIVDGRITVDAGPLSTGPVTPAVNLEGEPTAGGVEISAGGVIRLVSGGTAEIRGEMSAQGGTGVGPVDTRHGGLVEVIAEGDLTAGGTIDVSSANADGDILGVPNPLADGGAVMMFTRGSATMEAGLSIDATSVAGSGGFFALRAVGNINDGQGHLNTGPGGEAFLIADTVNITGDVTTDGGGLGIRGEDAVNIRAGAGLSTRAIPAGTDAFTGAASANKAGDLIVTSEAISIEAGATLRADGAGADNGGMLALVARNAIEGISWAIQPDAEVATITIDQASIVAGTVVISAIAEVSNSFGNLDDTVEASQVVEMEGTTTEAQFDAMLDNIMVAATDVMGRGLTTLNGLIPVQIQILSAEARVTITDSTIAANGNWDGLTATLENQDTEFANNGYLSPTGLRENTYQFFAPEADLTVATPLGDVPIISPLANDNPYLLNVKLPSEFDLAEDSLLIQSHAQNDLSIAPKAYGLGLAVASTRTTSIVDISDTALRTDIGNTRLASTAMENHSINIAAKKIANGAASVVVSVRDLTNQLLVDGGSIDSAGGITAGAWTGRNLSISSVANSGQEGRLAIAVNVDVSTSLTEAAVSGDITAGGDVAVDAESLFFDVTHVTNATMGLANVAKVIATHRNSNSSLTSFVQNLRSQSSGQDPSTPTKPHFGMGVAVGIQLSDDNTFATLGGNYHDLNSGRALTALGATNVTALGHDVAVNAAYRFADRGNEGGGGLTRSGSAAFGKLTFALQKMVDRHNNNPANVDNQITKEDLLGNFSNALMLNVSMASLLGETQAEVGGNATINAGSLNVNALTRYPNTNPVGALVNQWENFTDQVTNYNPLSTPGGTSVEPQAPPAPDLAGFVDIVNPLTYLTTESKTKAETPGDVTPGEEQELAIGVSLTLFNTENSSVAAIRNGADITVETEANVTALQESLFLHATNLPKSNPLGGDAKVNDSIGAGLHVGRTVSEVRAEIESGATVTVNSGDLDVSATTKNIAISLAYSGGQGADVAVNASIAAQISEADTVARIGETADITAQNVGVTARDSSVSWSTAGAITGSENVGVGASGVINFSRRNIWAGIGPSDRMAALAAIADPQQTVINATTLNILAENNSLDVTVGVAGTKVVGKQDPPADEEPPANTEEDDMIIPSWLFSDEENDAVNEQSEVDTPQDQSGQQQKSGWAVSGAAVVNISLGNETSAEILTNRSIDLTGALDVTARNNSTAVNVGGAVSAGLGSTKDTNALAGAFAVHVDNRIVRSRIVGAEINADGAVAVNATDLATVVNIAVGGAGTSRGDKAIAGSVAWAQLGGETTAEILNSDVTSTGLTVKADDQSTTVGVGGAVGVNMDATQGYGVGVGIAVNNVNRSATARVSGTGSVTTGSFLTQANSSQSIYGFGTSVGVGKTGLSGSISVNTISGGAKALVLGSDADSLTVKADAITVDADENNLIFSLGGALAGGRSTAVGGALTVNVVTATTEARLDDVIATKRDTGPDLGVVLVDADSSSTITSIAVAGAAAIDGNAAGVGLSGNEITANTITSLEGSTVTDAASITATADSTRIIHSLGGGAAFSGRGAAGVAATVNLLLANNTKVILNSATLTTRDAGTINAAATAGGEIKSLAAGLSASSSTAIGGAVTVNVTTAETQVTATGASITADGALTLRADDTADIDSLAGGVAVSLGGTGAGGAVAANFIGHDTKVLANGGSLTGEGVTLQAVNSSTIDSMAVGLAGGSSSAFAGSIAIGDIGNVTQAQAANTVLNAGTGAAVIDAGRTGDINILSGSAAVGGGSAVGVALTVATIHGGVTADLITNQSVSGSSLDVTARNTASIDALAISGAVGAGSVGGAGSVVYTQIGKPAADGPSVDPLSGPSTEDPVGDAQDTVIAERDQAITNLGTALGGSGSSTNVGSSDMALALNTDDVVRARVELTGVNPDMPTMNITTTETNTTRSLAGAVAVGSSAGIGAGIAVNMMFGRAEAELVLPSDQTTTADGAVTLAVTQTGTVETAGVAGAVGGRAGAAGSFTVNVMNRQAMARIIGTTPAGTGVLNTNGGLVDVTATQTGTISSLAGAVGIGGNAGVGGAIVVNVISDDAAASVENIQVDTSVSTDAAPSPYMNAGTVKIEAIQALTLEALAASVAGSGSGAFAGSFAVNIVDGNVTATLKNAAARANTVTVNADATPSLIGNGGAIAVSGVAAGLGIVTNVARQTVRADVDGSDIRAYGSVAVTATSTGSMAGNAIAGAAGSVAVTGSGVGNSAENTVEALIRDTAGNVAGSDVMTIGSVLVAAEGRNSISLLGGTDENPGLNINFSGGGTAGVGASVSVNTLKNDVRAAIEGNTRVVGLGHLGITTPAGTGYGVIMDASGSSVINMVSANGAVGGTAGVAALFNFNLIDDKARVQVGDAASGALVRINPGDGDIANEIGYADANWRQDVILNAQTSNTVQSIVANVAVGGSAGVGAGSGNTLVENLAEVSITNAQITARDNIDIDSSATTELDTVTLGLAGGFVGVSANASVNRIGSRALIGLDGTTLNAGDNVTANTLVDSDNFGLTGAVGGGAVGAAGTVQVTLFDSTSAIRIGKTAGGGNSSITAGDNIEMLANTVLANESSAVSGAVGAGAFALAANISLIEAETAVEIGNSETLTAGNDLSLSATDAATLKSLAGSAGLGSVGLGASLDYVNFAGTTKVSVGNNSTLNADIGTTPDALAGDLTLTATSVRDVDSGVAAIAAGSVGISGAVSIVEMGAIAEDDDDKRGDFLADAQTELDADQSGDGLDASASEEDKQNTGGSLVAFAGGTDTQNRITTSRQAIDLVGAPSNDVVKIEIGTNSRLNTRGNLTLGAGAATGVVQFAGGGAASLVGGITSGIAVANVGTGSAITIGNNSRLSADRDLKLLTGSSPIDGRTDVINSEAATLAAAGGLAVGVGVSVATLSSGASITLGDNVDLTGSVASKARSIELQALRSGVTRTNVANLTLGLAGGVGVAVSSATNTGISAIQIGSNPAASDTRILGNTITLTADDKTRAVSDGEGSTGGILAGINSVVITAENRGSGLVNITNTRIEGTTVTVENKSAASASAEATGVAVGAVAIGASVAESNMKVALASNVNATISANNITMRTKIYRDTYDHSTADASSTSGGLLAGNGAEAEAYADYSLTANYAGDFTASNKVLIETNAAAVVTDAYATGRSGGAVAIGVTIARSGNSAGQTSTVAASVNGATLTAGTAEIKTANAPTSKVRADSGSGGIVSGSGAETRVTTNTLTQTNLGNTGSLVVNADTIRVSTDFSGTLASKVDTLSAAALGMSGADSRTNVTSTVVSRVGGYSRFTAENFDISANTSVSRPSDGFNILSGSGGAIDVAAMVSRVDVTANTDLFIDSGASLTQTGLAGNNQFFHLGTFSNIALVDRLKLDAGGAIAVPIGDSAVKVNTNRGWVTLGAANIFSVDTLTIYSGGDANLRSEVDSTSYGFAGAASAMTNATYNADNRVIMGNGSRIESLGNIRLQTGYNALQVQNIVVNAEARAFNKTAIPINIDPVADARADTISRVDVQEGANVLAVRDVYLLAEQGGRDVLGYGRGKDLYREAAAAIGSGISEAFGGEPVSLDIETGTSTNISDDGILVNGYVRAGSRNRQILILDDNNNLNNASVSDQNTGEFYTDEMAEGIEYSIRQNVNLGSEINDRINLLQALIDDPIIGDPNGTGNNSAAVTAWTAERNQLATRAATLSGSADFIDLGDIIAAQGDIIIRADYVHGSNTGTLDAPGNATIKIHVNSDAFLNTAGMIIPEDAGGRITFNDIIVHTPEQIAALAGPFVTGPTDYEMISGVGGGDPLIEVATYGGGSLIVGGDIFNADGIARFAANGPTADLDVRGDISAKTIDLTAGRDFVQGFTWGFTEIEGEPGEIYEGYFDGIQAKARAAILNGFTMSSYDSEDLTVDIGPVSFNYGTIPEFTIAPRQGRIRGGRNVYITADKLNINGLIQAGTGSYYVNIQAGLDTYLAGLVADGSSGTVLLHDPSEPVNENVVRNPYITSDVRVTFDPLATDEFGNRTGQIILDPMIVQGGVVELTGEILSTGGGEIKSLDGFGNINVNSASTRPIVLGRVDLGALGELGEGVEGVVRITDTGRRVLARNSATNGLSVEFLTTEFRRIGDTFEERDNRIYSLLDIDLNDDGTPDITRTVIENLASSSTADDGRSGVYATRANRDLVINRSETVTQVTKNTQTTFYFWADFGTSKDSEVGPINATPLTADVAPGLNGIYLASSLPGGDYEYHFTGERISTSSANSNHHTDDQRFLGIGDVVKTWDSTQTATHLYTHRLKADYGVKISFDGADTGGLSIQNSGDVLLAGAVNNQVGDSLIRSWNGSVLSVDSSVLLSVGNLDAHSFGGRIGGLSTALRVDQTAGTTLNAIARDRIEVRETSGDMTIGTVATFLRDATVGNDLNGEISLVAEGSILAASDTSLILGSVIDLRAFGGTIGTDAQSLRTNVDGGSGSGTDPASSDIDGATLSARANSDIYIHEIAGDLPVNTIRSETGSVELTVSEGSILDRNNIETRDIRTESQLATLWTDDLNLNGSGLAARRIEQIDSVKAERKRSYDQYWTERTAAGGVAQVFTLDATMEQSLITGGWDQARVDAYVADRNALYALWNAGTAYDVDYEYTPTVDELAGLLDGIGWTTDELNQWVRASLIRGTGDTNARVEDPNISAAGDITLIARDEVGELLPLYVLGASNDLAEDLRVLSQAEYADVDIDNINNIVTVRRAEDINFAFTQVDANNHAVGNLRVSSSGGEIFLGAETAATIADVNGTSDVQIKIDGALTDNRDGTAAIRGSAIIVESGEDASIGTEANPLTFDILTGGSLIARSGQNVNIHAIGDMPLQEVFAGARAQISAVGHISDDTATGAVRIRAADLAIDGGSVGTDLVPLVIELTDAVDGRLDLQTRVGDAYLTAQSDLPIAKAVIAGGGRIIATAGASLHGANTISFGTTATLALLLTETLDLSASTGVDISGGTLEITSNGAVGVSIKRLETALGTLSFTALGAAVTSLFVNEADALRIETITQTHVDADTDIIAGGPVSIGTVTSNAEFRLLAQAITDGQITAQRTALIANGVVPGSSIGGTSRMVINTDRLFAQTTNGDIILTLNGAGTSIESLTAGGAGLIDFTSTATPVVLLAGTGIRTSGGAITANMMQMQANANITSMGGNIDLDTSGFFRQAMNTRLDAGTGRVDLDVGTDMVVAQVATQNTSVDALAVTVGGELSIVPGQLVTNFIANEAGSRATFDIGSLRPVGPEGLKVALADVDMLIRSGALHLQERDGIILTNVESRTGLIDIFANGETIVRVLNAAGGDNVTLSTSTGNLLADNATLSGGDMRLFAFGGAISGETSDTFMGDTTAGVTAHFYADGDLRYTETAGDLRVGFALSDTGDLVLNSPTGAMDLGVLGAAGDLTLTAQNVLRVNIIGLATVDLADEVAMQLVEPSFYGLREARSPQRAELTAFGTGSLIQAGLVSVKDNIGLHADDIDAHVYDRTPADDLLMQIDDSTGDFAETVDVQSIGDGPVLHMTDYFADVRPRLAGRDTAQGDLILTMARIGTGQVTHAGPRMVGLDVVINGDVWFRQRSFDLFSHIDYVALSTVADAQVYALNAGAMSFAISDEIVLTTENVLVLNRRLGGVDLNGGQGFAFGVGVETDILGHPFTFKGSAPGVTAPFVLEEIIKQRDNTLPLHLPQFITGNQHGEDCEIARCEVLDFGMSVVSAL